MTWRRSQARFRCLLVYCGSPVKEPDKSFPHPVRMSSARRRYLPHGEPFRRLPLCAGRWRHPYAGSCLDELRGQGQPERRHLGESVTGVQACRCPYCISSKGRSGKSEAKWPSGPTRTVRYPNALIPKLPRRRAHPGNVKQLPSWLSDWHQDRYGTVRSALFGRVSAGISWIFPSGRPWCVDEAVQPGCARLQPAIAVGVICGMAFIATKENGL